MNNSSDNRDICSKQCGSKCCRSTPPALTKNDIERITTFTNSNKWYEMLEFNQRKTPVILKQKDKEKCLFLTDEGLCSIYTRRPLDCMFFPLFIQIEQKSEIEYNIRWLVWYCLLTEKIGMEALKKEAMRILITKLFEDPNEIFEYQEAMYTSRSYKQKHFFVEERLKIQKEE